MYARVPTFESDPSRVDDSIEVVRSSVESEDTPEGLEGAKLLMYTPQAAPAARLWIVPSRESFPDLQMEIVDLIAEGEKVVGRFRCSATNLGPWRGQPPTGGRFERVDEVYIFRIRDGQITEAWGIEDTRSRERQLGLSPRR